MIERVLRALKISPDEIACIEQGLYAELPVRLRNLQYTDPFERIQEEKLAWKIFQDFQLTLMIGMRMRTL